MSVDRELQWHADLAREAGENPNHDPLDALLKETHLRGMRLMEAGPRYAAGVNVTIRLLELQGRALQALVLTGDASGFLECAHYCEDLGKWERAADFYDRAGKTANAEKMRKRLAEKRKGS